jgi:hypothetical protein
MAQPLRLPREDECLGIHLPPSRPDCIELRWEPVRNPAERVRIQAYTCCCRLTFYELCQSGGLLFIRRTRRDGDGIVMEECVRTVHSRGMMLWDRLLEGLVR